jgi:predicted Zn-dependent protease
VQASLARKPNDPLLLYLQAEILAQKHPDSGSPEFQLAVRSARRAVALQPTLGAAQGVLAKLSLQAGNYQEAAVECRKALASDPTDQAAVYHLIQARRKMGKTEELPDLLKRLALLRQQAEKDERDRYRFKLVEGDGQ